MSNALFNIWRMSLFLICLFIATCIINSAPTASETTENVLGKLIKSIYKLLKYCRDHYQEATLDLIFGLRVIQGQCQLLIEEQERGQLEMSLSGSDSVNSTLIEIKRVAKEAGIYANMAVPHLREHDIAYFNLMSKLSIGPWKVFHPHRIVDPSLKWKISGKKPLSFSESESDVCVGELLGSGSKSAEERCQVTKVCLQRMLGLGQSGRQLQRQVFYSIVSQMVGCERYLNEYLLALTKFRNVEQLQHELCSNAYFELSDPSSLTMNNVDLFAEIQFLCPSIGYFQFLRKEWLDAMLSWQSKEGCFPGLNESQPSEHLFATTSTISNVLTNEIINSMGHDVEKESANVAHVERTDVNISDVQAAAFGDVPQLDRHIQGYLDPPSNAQSTRYSGHIVIDSSTNQLKQYAPVENFVENVEYSKNENLHGVQQQNVIHYPPINRDKLPNYQRVPIAQDRYYLGVQRKLHSVDPQLEKNDGDWLIHDQTNNGCRSHLTSVTAAALGMYLRYVIDAGPPEFFQLRLEAFKPPMRRVSATTRKVRPIFQTPPPPKTVWIKPVAPGNVYAHHDSLSPTNQDLQPSPDLNHMAVEAKKYMGIYQRQWSPHYGSSSVGHHVQNGQGHNIIDYVNRPNLVKDLPDWTILYNPTLTTAIRAVTKTTVANDKHPHKGSLIVTPVRIELAVEGSQASDVQVIDIESDWIQRDLGRYLVAITVMSLVCLVVLFRYFCYRKNICKGKGRKSLI